METIMIFFGIFAVYKITFKRISPILHFLNIWILAPKIRVI